MLVNIKITNGSFVFDTKTISAIYNYKNEEYPKGNQLSIYFSGTGFDFDGTLSDLIKKCCLKRRDFIKIGDYYVKKNQIIGFYVTKEQLKFVTTDRTYSARIKRQISDKTLKTLKHLVWQNVSGFKIKVK